MTGANPYGEPVTKMRPDARPYKGLLDEETARDLRVRMHAGLESAGYTAPEIERISGWSGRTIRRDLEGNPNAPSDPDRDRRDDPRRDVDQVDRRKGKPRPGRDSNPGRLTEREAQELKFEYGSAGNAEVAAFLASLSAGGRG